MVEGVQYKEKLERDFFYLTNSVNALIGTQNTRLQPWKMTP